MNEPGCLRCDRGIATPCILIDCTTHFSSPLPQCNSHTLESYRSAKKEKESIIIIIIIIITITIIIIIIIIIIIEGRNPSKKIFYH